MKAVNSDSLLGNVLSFSIGDPSDPLTFTRRLANDNGWDINFANRCVTEYKKFLYLASLSPLPLTPSDEVDQVWHLHLTYTHSYWHQLCGEVLPEPLHHHPTRGGKQEQLKYRQQYQNTLDFYQQQLGEIPPKDIWPSVDRRFNAKNNFVRINLSAFWYLKKPSSSGVAAAVLPLLLIACSPDTDEGLWFYVKWAIGIYIAYRVIRWLGSKGGGSGGGCGGASGCGDGGCGGGGCGG